MPSKLNLEEAEFAKVNGPFYMERVSDDATENSNATKLEAFAQDVDAHLSASDASFVALSSSFVALSSSFVALQTTASLTLYVDASGSDSADGTAAHPLATLGAALDRIPRIVKHSVTVNIGSGTFSENLDAHFDVDPPGQVQLLGTTGSYVPATGPASGTMTSCTGRTVVVADAGWTENELRGKFLKNGTSGHFVPIAANTIDTITTSASGVFTGPTFTVMEMKTVLNGSADSSPVIRIGSSDAVDASTIAFVTKYVKITDVGTAKTTLVYLDKGQAYFNNCSIVGRATSGQSLVTVLRNANLSTFYSIFSGSEAARKSVHMFGQSAFDDTGGLFDGGVVYAAYFRSRLSFGLSTIQNVATTRAIILGPHSVLEMSNSVLDRSADGIDFYGPGSHAYLYGSTQVSNCTGFGVNLGIASRNISSAGNGLAMEATVSMTGNLNDMTIDGTNGTSITTLRSAPSKTVVDSNTFNRLASK